MDQKWKAVLDLAAAYYGLVARWQVVAAGLTERQIERAVADGLLTVVTAGVYRVRGAPRSERMAIAAAALAADSGVSFGAAGALLRLDAPAAVVPIDVTVLSGAGHPRVRRVEVETAARGFHPVVLHRARPSGLQFVTVDGIACTDAARTLTDLAARLSYEDLDDAFERARRLGLVTPAVLARRSQECARVGAAKLRDLVAHARPGPLDSKLEGRAWRMLLRSAIPEPVRQHWVQVTGGRGYRIDFAWPDLLVAVEAEGFAWHGGRAQWKADRLRVAALERLGWRVLVVTWDDVVLRPDETLDRIEMALAERAALARVV